MLGSATPEHANLRIDNNSLGQWGVNENT